jgi:hypothetical protein
MGGVTVGILVKKGIIFLNSLTAKDYRPEKSTYSWRRAV